MVWQPVPRGVQVLEESGGARKTSRLFRVIAFPPGYFRFTAKICWENGRCQRLSGSPETRDFTDVGRSRAGWTLRWTEWAFVLLPYGVRRLVHDHRITGGLVLTQGRGLVEDVHESVGDSVVNDVHEGVDEEGGWGHPGEPLSGSLVQLRLPSSAARGQGEGMTALETTLGWLLGARRGKTTLITFFFCPPVLRLGGR